MLLLLFLACAAAQPFSADHAIAQLTALVPPRVEARTYEMYERASGRFMDDVTAWSTDGATMSSVRSWAGRVRVYPPSPDVQLLMSAPSWFADDEMPVTPALARYWQRWSAPAATHPEMDLRTATQWLRSVSGEPYRDVAMAVFLRASHLAIGGLWQSAARGVIAGSIGLLPTTNEATPTAVVAVRPATVNGTRVLRFHVFLYPWILERRVRDVQALVCPHLANSGDLARIVLQY